MRHASRRHFLTTLAATGGAMALPRLASAHPPKQAPNVVMVYLKGGNDGYNTVVPLGNARYQKLRPNLALKREQTIVLNERQGLHSSLQAALPLLQDGDLAIVQGIGQQDVTNQHYRDAETLFTASGPDEFLDTGWMTRALTQNRTLLRPTIDVLAFGDLDIREADPMGPFRGGGAEVGVVNMLYPQEWATRRVVSATSHLTTQKAAGAVSFRLDAPAPLATPFGRDSFGQSLKSIVELARAGLAPPVVHVTLNSEDGDHHHAFDTHWDQLKYHGPTLTQLAEGLAAFRAGMREIGQWNNTLLFTYDEFGRSPKENDKQGTHHGWANVQFVAGGRVKGGLVGEPLPVVDVFGIDGPAPTIDIRRLYTTVIESFWGGTAAGVFSTRMKPLDLIRA
jgi:uncharacterized protein (DUF1501 family)